MRLGLIARADHSGLATQTGELYRHLHPARTLVIDVGHLHDHSQHCNKATDLSRYPGAMVCHGWTPDREQVVEFLDGLDTVFTCETPYSPLLYLLAEQRGIRTVCQYNLEFLRLRDRQPSLLAAPTRWRWDDVPEPKILLPVPVALDRFPARLPARHATHFLHTVGRPAIHDRNGTTDLLRALRHVTAHITVTVKTQDRALNLDRYLYGVPANVRVRIDRTDTPNYWDNYTDQDVLVMPRRYGGLCLPQQEALAAGLPVIMTDISPNRDLLPPEWLVQAHQAGSFAAANQITYHRADPHALAARIDTFATDTGMFAKAQTKAREIARSISWDALLPRYREVLDLDP